MSIPYMPLYVADYEADTAHLSIEEDGVYMRLLRLCWRTPGCSLPDDDEWIKRRLRVSESEWQRVAAPIIAEFFKRDKGRLFSVRLHREHERINDTHQKRRDAGRKGGRPRKTLETHETGERRAKAKQKPGQSNQNQNQNHIRDFLTEVCTCEAADDFIAHRKVKGAKLTPRAAQLIAGKLRGHPNPDAVLRESIANGWTGVFPDKLATTKEVRSGADVAKRAAERWAARRMDSGPGQGSVVPLLPARDCAGG